MRQATRGHCLYGRVAYEYDGRAGPADYCRFEDRRRRERLRRAEDLLGTRAPERRASESPMAIACARLFTLACERPLRSVPRFCSLTTRATLRELDLL